MSRASAKAPDTSESEAKRRRRQKFGKKAVEANVVVGLTEEQRLDAMLGRGYTQGKEDPRLVMEQYCGCCGTEHRHPELLDCYYLCASCQNALREPMSKYLSNNHADHYA